MSLGDYTVRVAIAAAGAAAAALVVVYVRHIADLLLVVFAGLLLAVALEGVARVTRRRLDVPRRASVLAILFGGSVLLGLLGWWTGPRVVDQVTALPSRLAAAAHDLRASLSSTAWGRGLVDRIWTDLQQHPVSRVAGGVTGAFSTVFGAITRSVTILVLGVFLAWSPRAYVDPLLDLVPAGSARDRARSLLRTLTDALQSWMIGRLESMLVVGVLTVAALLVAGVPLALALGTIAGLLSFVPFLGPILSMIPAVLVGLGEGTGTALVVAAIFLGVQLVETNLITPIIIREEISLPPAYVITAQAVMGMLFGLIGVAVATPLALVPVVLVDRLYLGSSPAAEEANSA